MFWTEGGFGTRFGTRLDYLCLESFLIVLGEIDKSSSESLEISWNAFCVPGSLKLFVLSFSHFCTFYVSFIFFLSKLKKIFVHLYSFFTPSEKCSLDNHWVPFAWYYKVSLINQWNFSFLLLLGSNEVPIIARKFISFTIPFLEMTLKAILFYGKCFLKFRMKLMDKCLRKYPLCINKLSPNWLRISFFCWCTFLRVKYHKSNWD